MTTGFAGAASCLVSQALEDEGDDTVSLLSTSSEENHVIKSEDEDDLVVPKKGSTQSIGNSYGHLGAMARKTTSTMKRNIQMLCGR